MKYPAKAKKLLKKKGGKPIMAKTTENTCGTHSQSVFVRFQIAFSHLSLVPLGKAPLAASGLFDIWSVELPAFGPELWLSGSFCGLNSL